MKAWHYVVLAFGVIMFLNDMRNDFELAKSLIHQING